MEKKSQKLLILTGILLLLLVVFMGMRVRNQKQEEKKEEQTKAERIYITDLENISEISYEAGNGRFTFTKKDGKWSYTEDSDFPLKQSIPENLADTFGKLEAKRKLEDGDALDAYGLDKPVYKMRMTTAEGKSTVLNFGNTTEDSYYLNVEGTDTVYTVSSEVTEAFQYTMDELAQFDKYPDIGSGNLLKETITKNGKTMTYDSENKEDTEELAAAAGGLGAVTLDAAADYSVSDADLPKYGLDDKTRITVKALYTENDTEEELTLYLGKENGSDKRYVMVNDSRIVYLVSTAVCDNILNRQEE